jgi:beta-phosphoglucomutase
MLKAVIFDMDGIIIDSEPIYHKVEMNMFKELGLDLTDEHRYVCRH